MVATQRELGRNNSMDKYHLHWFTDEISMHVTCALASIEQVQTLLAVSETRQRRDVWFHLTSFLTHTAMVSKIICPSDKANQRGEAMLKHLEVPDDSPLLARSARNNAEHIDERIDRWVNRGNAKVLEMVLDDRESFNYIANEDTAIRRVLIQNEMIYISEDNEGARVETRLLPMIEALRNIEERCAYKLVSESPYSYVLS